jgi:hypothetical protein
MNKKLLIISIACFFIVSCNSITPEERIRAWNFCKEVRLSEEFEELSNLNDSTEEGLKKFQQVELAYEQTLNDVRHDVKRCENTNCNYDNVKKMVAEQCGINVSFFND